ncbi:MAG: phospholipase D-like domain-containing protein, partial [Chitinophagaceae bacterium]
QRIAFDIPEADKSWVRMRRNDWVRRKNQISRTYLELLRTAQHEVIIVCSYFMPGRLLQKNLQQALQRGVKVKILLAGLSDVVMAKNAERYMYDWLLRNGVELYEFTGTVLHAKIAMADGQWYTVGSYNVNNISAYASVELNLDVRGGPTIAHTHQRLLQLLQQHSVRITTEQHLRAKNWIKQFGRWSSYQLIRVIFYLFTFYFKQHN